MLSFDVDYRNEYFVGFAHKRLNADLAICRKFWEDQDFRLAELNKLFGLPMVIDRSLTMHEVPDFHQSLRLPEHADFIKGVQVARANSAFSTPVSMPIWYGWFTSITNQFDLPLHPQIMWNYFVHSPNFFADSPEVCNSRH